MSDAESSVTQLSTALKEAERQLEEAREGLTRLQQERDGSYRRYRRIFERSKDVIIVSHPSGDLVDINQAGLDLYDYPSKEAMLEIDLALEMWAHSSDREEYVRQLREFGFVKDFEADHRTRTGEVITVVGTTSIVTDDQGGIFEMLTILRDISEQKRLSRELERLARTDSLTGLSNRVVFRERLEIVLSQWRRDRTRFSLLMLDIDNLKEINDAWGHPAGDILLKAVAERFRRNIREVDTLARFGGDEFALILTDVESDEEVDETAARLVSCLGPPIETAGGALQTSVSIGVALSTEEDPTPDQLIQRSDRALYRAKGRGGNQFAK